MSLKDDYESRSEKLVEPILKKHGFTLYDVEYVKEAGTYYLRLYIDKEGGITIDDCEAVSREFSDLLDSEDFIPDAYILEISSPGLGRQLKKDRHFMNSIGEEVEVKLFSPVNGSKEHTGILKAYTGKTVTVQTEDGAEIEFDRAGISVIRLTVDF